MQISDVRTRAKWTQRHKTIWRRKRWKMEDSLKRHKNMLGDTSDKKKEKEGLHMKQSAANHVADL
uniref:Uncharacterized protein n=1 Tax=Octopus bimaculoides TaxID=37653 RepID=A0A0L8GX56_OCTBM